MIPSLYYKSVERRHAFFSRYIVVVVDCDIAGWRNDVHVDVEFGRDFVIKSGIAF